MELILWRHAEAEEGVGMTDAERRLTARGEKQAHDMAQWLRSRLPKKIAILASPTVRTQQTAGALARPFKVEPKIAPGATATDLLAACGWCGPPYMLAAAVGVPLTVGGPQPALRRWPDCRSDAVLLVGHQPVLGRLAALLLAGAEDEWTFKKGVVWWFAKRTRAGRDQVLLRAVMNPDLLR